MQTQKKTYSVNINVVGDGSDLYDFMLERHQAYYAQHGVPANMWMPANTKGVNVKITEIQTVETVNSDGHCELYVYVVHDQDGVKLYGDRAVAAAVSAVVGRKLQFTELGMQEPNLSSLELLDRDCC